ncbi:MAG: polysaccharide deacetylase family protein [Clostridia bacterium]|nr:polysaccharide deacetylase family protein [Clostridia bacterium]
MKKIIAFLTVITLCFCTLWCEVAAVPAKEIHWYTTRNKEHKQALVPPDLSFVENHGGVYIDHRHDDSNPDKVIYLTFDVGYENGNVEKTLNTLKETQTPGAFFVLKHFVTENRDLVLRMAEEGHLICNHTANHPNLANASREKINAEITALEKAVEEVTGSGTKPYFRPPEGSFSLEMLETVQSLGYKTVFWSFAYADWDNNKQQKPSVALSQILTHMHNGAVILLHPTSATNAEILPELINTLKKEGYRFGTLDELCFAR